MFQSCFGWKANCLLIKIELFYKIIAKTSTTTTVWPLLLCLWFLFLVFVLNSCVFSSFHIFFFLFIFEGSTLSLIGFPSVSVLSITNNVPGYAILMIWCWLYLNLFWFFSFFICFWNSIWFPADDLNRRVQSTIDIYHINCFHFLIKLYTELKLLSFVMYPYMYNS